MIGQIPEHVGIISIAYRYTETVVEAESDRGIESHPGTKYGRDKQTIAPTTRSTRLNHLDLITQPENEDAMITVTVTKPRPRDMGFHQEERGKHKRRTFSQRRSGNRDAPPILLSALEVGTKDRPISALLGRASQTQDLIRNEMTENEQL